MILSGVVIDVKPERASAALAGLKGRKGVIRLRGPVVPGRLVSVLEAPDHRAMESLIESILAIDGVINVNPAYIHFDDRGDTQTCSG